MNILHGFPKIVFEFGAVQSLPEELAALGIKRPLIITDQGLIEHGVFEYVRGALDGRNDFALFDKIPENPTIAGVIAGRALYEAAFTVTEALEIMESGGHDDGQSSVPPRFPSSLPRRSRPLGAPSGAGAGPNATKPGLSASAASGHTRLERVGKRGHHLAYRIDGQQPRYD